MEVLAGERAPVLALHAEQWRTLPPLRAVLDLGDLLAHPINYSLPAHASAGASGGGGAGSSGLAGYDQAASRRSPLGSMIHLMRSAAISLPAVAARAITLSSLRLLRHASLALGDATATLLRTEGSLPIARGALLSLLAGAVDRLRCRQLKVEVEWWW